MDSKKWLLALCLGLSTTAPAGAAFVTSLYGTGLNGDRTVRANDQTELHYTLASGPITGTPVIYTAAGGFPVPPWLGDAASTTSRWIAPTVTRNHPGGTYVYRTTFDLTGFLPETATITGRWATDNGGTDILLNGTSLGFTSGGFTAFSTFGATNGSLFVAGTNTLDFVVVNAGQTSGNPNGLRVEVAADATLSPVPVPPTVLLGVLGVGTAGLARSVRRRQA